MKALLESLKKWKCPKYSGQAQLIRGLSKRTRIISHGFQRPKNSGKERLKQKWMTIIILQIMIVLKTSLFSKDSLSRRILDNNHLSSIAEDQLEISQKEAMKLNSKDQNNKHL